MRGLRAGGVDLAQAATSGVLAGLALLHVAWGRGRNWPLADRGALASAVLGVEADPEARPDGGAAFPSAPSCYAVAAALAAACVAVSGVPVAPVSIRRAGIAGLVAVLAGRGLLGVTGRTAMLVPAATGDRFRRLDRRVYGPLCLTLAGGATRSWPRTPQP